MLYLGSIGIHHVISELCYKGSILQRNYLKMTISWQFSYNSFVIFHGKRILEPKHDVLYPILWSFSNNSGSPNITKLYPNPCHNEVWYKGTALYRQSKFRYKKRQTDLFLFCMQFNVPVNSNYHVETVSSPNHTFSWAKPLTSTSCTYFPL